MGSIQIRFFAFLFLLLPVTSQSEALAKAQIQFEEEETYLLDPEILHPTQFNAGLDEIAVRRRMMEGMLKSPGKLARYLAENRASAVVGPGGELYLIDGHHISRAALDAGLKKVQVEIIKDYSDLSLQEFWKKLVEKDWAYLYDQGKLRPASELPKTLKELTDDPFRTLAWLVRKVGGYEKVKIPFTEFKWANFFRERLKKVDFSTPESTQSALNRALELAASKEARDLMLPGALDDGPKSLTARSAAKCRAKYMELESRLFR